MLRRLVSKLFGFETELSELRRQIKELSWDTSFGMWTRGALYSVLSRNAARYSFIDLNHIYELNE